jgi:hypothetical protein
MTKSDPNSGPETPEETESLSATGMFLRAFQANAETAKDKDKPESSAPGAGPAPNQQVHVGDRPLQQSAEPSEFTRMFQGLEPRGNSVPQTFHDAPTQMFPATSQPVPPSEPLPPTDQEPGEFTRIFVAAAAPPANPPAKKVEETPRPAAPAVSQSRAKGFSSPGGSDSASAEGSFTQIFKAQSPQSAPKPTPPAPPSAPISPSSSQAKSWQNDPIFRPKDDPIFRPVESESRSAQSSPSVTNLLSSLSPSGSAPPGSKPQEPAPYRPEPLPSYSAPSRPPKQNTESAGVTKLMDRLAPQPPSHAAPPPPAAFAPPEDSGPGEFTRIMSGVPPQATAHPLPPAQAAPAPANFAPPALPAAPVFRAPAIHAPAPALPPVPKSAPPPVPAFAAPKGKFDGLVPILLVVNTFLLVVILLVLIFSIKSR